MELNKKRVLEILDSKCKCSSNEPLVLLQKEEHDNIISLDYRVEYHKKVEECELLQAKYDYLWHTILKEK